MREDEGMGHPDLKYGDSMVFIQHRDTGLWLSYVTFETKKRGIGRVEEKKVGWWPFSFLVMKFYSPA